MFRGKSFREEYLQLPKLRSVYTGPVMLLTATYTVSMMAEIMNMMHLKPEGVKVVSMLRDR